MAELPVPPGYSTMRDALRRASETWRADGHAKFVGLLIAGEVKCWAVSSAGDIDEVAPEYWKKARAFELARDRDEVRNGTFSSVLGRPIFATAELTRVLPFFWEKSSADEHPRGATKTGRKSKAGADEFWLQVFRLYLRGEQGDTQSRQTQKGFIDAMVKWVEDNDPGLYAPATIEDKIKLFWRRLELTPKE